MNEAALVIVALVFAAVFIAMRFWPTPDEMVGQKPTTPRPCAGNFRYYPNPPPPPNKPPPMLKPEPFTSPESLEAARRVVML